MYILYTQSEQNCCIIKNFYKMTYEILNLLNEFFKKTITDDDDETKKIFQNERLPTLILKYIIFNMFPETWESLFTNIFTKYPDKIKKQIDALTKISDFTKPSVEQLWELLHMINPYFSIHSSGCMSLEGRIINIKLDYLAEFSKFILQIGLDQKKILPLFITLLSNSEISRDILFDVNVMKKMGINFNFVKTNFTPLIKNFNNRDYEEKLQQLANSLKFSDIDISSVVDTHHLPLNKRRTNSLVNHKQMNVSDIDYYDLIQGSLPELQVDTKDIINLVTHIIEDNAKNINFIDERIYSNLNDTKQFNLIKQMSDTTLINDLEKMDIKKLFKLEKKLNLASQHIQKYQKNDEMLNEILINSIIRLTKQKENLINSADRSTIYILGKNSVIRSDDTANLKYLHPDDLRSLEEKIELDIGVLCKHQLVSQKK